MYLADAYLQIKVEENSKELLTINTHRGLYRYNRLCFGVKCAPGIFQQTMDTMLAGLLGVVSYLDDLIVVGKPEEGHINNLHKVFERISEWGFHVKAEKCEINLKHINYLGFIVDKHGRRPDPSKVDANPNGCTKIKIIYWYVNYYGQFIKEMRLLRMSLRQTSY